eukprot:464897-Pelagomonas_calceolata.AAC.3
MPLASSSHTHGHRQLGNGVERFSSWSDTELQLCFLKEKSANVVPGRGLDFEWKKRLEKQQDQEKQEQQQKSEVSQGESVGCLGLIRGQESDLELPCFAKQI